MWNMSIGIIPPSHFCPFGESENNMISDTKFLNIAETPPVFELSFLISSFFILLFLFN